MSAGIDYGRGQTNIDKNNGIRFGVISSHEVLQAWADSSEGYYGDPSCPKCGHKAQEYSERDEDEDTENGIEFDGTGGDYCCESCRYHFDSDEAYGDEPISHYIDDEEYTAEQGGDDCDIFITKSPYYTRAAFCSPCAPGACYLASPCDEGERAYCFGHDWFEGGKAPYPVYRVSDDSLILPGTDDIGENDSNGIA